VAKVALDLEKGPIGGLDSPPGSGGGWLSPMLETDFSELETKLPYRFKNIEFLLEALRHSSFVNEQPQSDLRDNERLEFLGDAVLNLVIGHLLMAKDQELAEGDLSRIRAELVNESQLADLARSIGLGEHLLLGKGEIQTHGREKNSILADAFEALMAAIYLDGGFDSAYRIVEGQFGPLLSTISAPGAGYDYKSQLQERVQVSHHQVPRYKVIEESGPDHDKTFRVVVQVCGIQAEGEGKSKKLAEQNAARRGLEMLTDPS
jgi:ribonuclease-3